MEQVDRERLERVLRRIPKASWDDFLSTSGGRRLRRRLDSIEEALAGTRGSGRAGRIGTTERVAQLLGYGVMQDPHCGPWIREQLLGRASLPAWSRLLSAYAALRSRKTVAVRRNSSQRGGTPAAVAAYWHQGGTWARQFSETFGLPDAVWQRKGSRLPDDEEVVPTELLPLLHDYKRGAYARLREVLARRGRGRTALLSLPTGAWKTRVVVAICDHLAESAGKGGRARSCGSPTRTAVRRMQPLRLVRLWGGRDPDMIGDESEEPVVLVASVDQLASWARRAPRALERLRGRRLACAVVDEAHVLIYERVMSRWSEGRAAGRGRKVPQR